MRAVCSLYTRLVWVFVHARLSPVYVPPHPACFLWQYLFFMYMVNPTSRRSTVDLGGRGDSQVAMSTSGSRRSHSCGAGSNGAIDGSKASNIPRGGSSGEGVDEDVEGAASGGHDGGVRVSPFHSEDGDAERGTAGSGGSVDGGGNGLRAATRSSDTYGSGLREGHERYTSFAARGSETASMFNRPSSMTQLPETLVGRQSAHEVPHANGRANGDVGQMAGAEAVAQDYGDYGAGGGGRVSEGTHRNTSLEARGGVKMTEHERARFDQHYREQQRDQQQEQQHADDSVGSVFAEGKAVAGLAEDEGMIGGFKFRIGVYTAVILGQLLLSTLATFTVYHERNVGDSEKEMTNIQHMLFLLLIALVDGGGVVLLLVFGGAATYRYHYNVIARAYRQRCLKANEETDGRERVHGVSWESDIVIDRPGLF